MLLEVGSPLIDQVDLYAPGSQGQYFRETSGLVVPVQKRTFQYRRPVFPLTLPPGVSRTFYMRFQDHGSVPYSIRLWDPTAFTYRTDAEKYALGLYYGAMGSFFCITPCSISPFAERPTCTTSSTF